MLTLVQRGRQPGEKEATDRGGVTGGFGGPGTWGWWGGGGVGGVGGFRFPPATLLEMDISGDVVGGESFLSLFFFF